LVVATLLGACAPTTVHQTNQQSATGSTAHCSPTRSGAMTNKQVVNVRKSFSAHLNIPVQVNFNQHGGGGGQRGGGYCPPPRPLPGYGQPPRRPQPRPCHPGYRPQQPQPRTSYGGNSRGPTHSYSGMQRPHSVLTSYR